MSREEILRRWPNASESFIRRNLTVITVNRDAESPQPERPVRDGANGKVSRAQGNPRRCRVSIVSFRRRACDPDNLAPKYFIDGLRYCGIIADDTAKHIELTVRQEKAETDYTEITVEPL